MSDLAVPRPQTLRHAIASTLGHVLRPRSLLRGSTDNEPTSRTSPPSGQHDGRGGSATLGGRLKEVFLCSYDLGFTAFGGPPVHFQIFHRRFVERYKWIDEQTYQELFGICQSLPGPGSTQMGFAIVLTRAGVVPAIFWFSLWSLPGAVGIFGLAQGIAQLNEKNLSPVVFALLSGSNAATVGIITAAAVQLSQNVIQDRLTRIVLIGVGSAGICFNALWFFPMLISLGACATILFDTWGRNIIRSFVRRRNGESQLESSVQESTNILELNTTTASATNRAAHSSLTQLPTAPEMNDQELPNQLPGRTIQPPQSQTVSLSVGFYMGSIIVILFFASFIAVVVLRGTLKTPPVVFKLFANMFLAGTILFGGGPVVVPLLREYIVTEGWVSSRDFLIGVAIIQAFPGPNFNFAVYLSALASTSARAPASVTALVGFIGIFMPGLTLVVGLSPLWSRLRRFRIVRSGLRGLNAAAVGLVWTAVYRLWEIGYLRSSQSGGDATNGVSLGLEPWWVVVGTVSFSANRWLGASPPFSILCGVVMGIGWWAVVKPR